MAIKVSGTNYIIPEAEYLDLVQGDIPEFVSWMQTNLGLTFGEDLSGHGYWGEWVESSRLLEGPEVATAIGCYFRSLRGQPTGSEVGILPLTSE